MARVLPQILRRISSSVPGKFPPPLSSSSSGAAVHRRNRSHQSGGEDHPAEADLKSDGDKERDALGYQRLEAEVRRIVVERAAPTWLPFVPGTSYWVPPGRRRNLVEVADKLSSSSSVVVEEYLHVPSLRGWPCSAYFVDQGKVLKVEVKMHSHPKSTSKLEDQEGYTEPFDLKDC